MPDQREEGTDTSRAPVTTAIPVPSTRGTKRKADDEATLKDDDKATATSAGVTGTTVDSSTTTAAAATTTSHDPEQQVNKSQKKPKKTKREEEQEDMAWICAACKEAECGLVLEKNDLNQDGDKGKEDDKQDAGVRDKNVPAADDDAFVFCDGPCGRIFHVPCAGLGGIPEADEWLCKDCTQQRHACAYCAEYGRDGIDVFPCSRVEEAACGLFFHEACLQANGVEYKYATKAAAAAAETMQLQQHNMTTNKASDNEDDEEDEDDAQQRIPVFTCPAHNCWTCTQNDMIQLERDEEAEERKNRKNAPKKRGKQAKKKKSSFQCKPSARLFRCLECPRAFHVTCIPLTARFHELAVLCHEHAGTHKLPDLDLASSIQMRVENRIDKGLMRLHGIKRGRLGASNLLHSGKGASANPFFSGLRGDKLNSVETQLLGSMRKVTASLFRDAAAAKVTALEKNDGDVSNVQNNNLPDAFTLIMDGNVPFCLPVDFRDEVFSKPPTYTHITTNRLLDPTIPKPKRLAGADIGEGGQCSCTGTRCGPDCFNRITMSECTGPQNCNFGTKDCENRALSKRQFAKCKPKRESGKGWGLVTLNAISKGQLVHEYVGEIVDEKKKEDRLKQWNMEHPNDPNFYIMALGAGYYVDAREHGNQTRFINHSCDPNTRVATINVRGTLRNGIYAIRDIKAGEFLSYDYHFDTKHGDRFICRCGSTNCRGTMKEGRNDVSGASGNRSKNKRVLWKEAKERLEADRKFLKSTKTVKSLVGALVPGAEHERETVGVGPQTKYRNSGVFLFRNAQLGADFVSRKSRLER